MVEPTQYEILEVARSASPEVIRAAYKSLSQRWHPDRNPSNLAEAERRIKGIDAAYELLSDPAKRALYDAKIGAQVDCDSYENSPSNQASPGRTPYGAGASGESEGCTGSARIHSLESEARLQWANHSIRRLMPGSNEGLLAFVLPFAAILLLGLLWLFVGRMALVLGGSALACLSSCYLIKVWIRERSLGGVFNTAMDLSWLMTGTVWAWIPFAIGMEWKFGSLISLDKVPFYAVIISAWIPAFGLARVAVNKQEHSLILTKSKIYGLLFLMCLIQVSTYLAFSPAGQDEVLRILGYRQVGAPIYIAALAGFAGGAIILSILYAAVLFLFGGLLGNAFAFGMRFIAGVRVDSNVPVLAAGWAIVPMLVFMGTLWNLLS